MLAKFRHGSYLNPNQILLMHEGNQYSAELLNEYYERDIREREEREALVRAYREWDVEAHAERGDNHGGADRD